MGPETPGLDSMLRRKGAGHHFRTELIAKRFLEEVPFEPGSGRTPNISSAKTVGWGGKAFWGEKAKAITQRQSGGEEGNQNEWTGGEGSFRPWGRL